jgi:hypothetical protein
MYERTVSQELPLLLTPGKRPNFWGFRNVGFGSEPAKG